MLFHKVFLLLLYLFPFVPVCFLPCHFFISSGLFKLLSLSNFLLIEFDSLFLLSLIILNVLVILLILILNICINFFSKFSHMLLNFPRNSLVDDLINSIPHLLWDVFKVINILFCSTGFVHLKLLLSFHFFFIESLLVQLFVLSQFLICFFQFLVWWLDVGVHDVSVRKKLLMVYHVEDPGGEVSSSRWLLL